jgi:hypothetical protein
VGEGEEEKGDAIVKESDIVGILRKLLIQLFECIDLDNKKNEVDELSQNIAIFYNKEIGNCPFVDGMTMYQAMERISQSKVKNHKSLTPKTVFKFMDLVEM